MNPFTTPTVSTSWSKPSILPQFVNYRDELSGIGTVHADGRMASARRELAAIGQQWTAFFALRFAMPPGVFGVLPRIKRNLQHFTPNYLCMPMLLMTYCVLTSFLVLISVIALGGMFYKIYKSNQKGPMILIGYTIPPWLLYTLALMLCSPMFILANVGYLLYWVMGISTFITLVHSTFYRSEELPGCEFESITI